MGLEFEVDVADVDENVSGRGEDIVCCLAQRKAEAVAQRRSDAVILAADTVVCLEDEVLGKPKDEEDAKRMIRRLSGGWHEVYTGVCVWADGRADVQAARTRVHFVEISDEEIVEYMLRGEAMDKAGAYGIQGAAGVFIDRIDGCPHNVMGLPLALTRAMLRARGI